MLEELDEREDGDTREAWWAEIRQEVRSHARALACNIILLDGSDLGLEIGVSVGVPKRGEKL